MRRYVPPAILVLVYLIVGTLYAIYTPDWQAPDEPAHYNYVRQLESGQFPIIEPGDYDQDYQSLVISSKFDSQYSIEGFQYEDYQPPLYYLLQAPIFSLTDGLLRPMRLLSVFLGAGVVVFAYLITRQLFPGQSWLALIAAAFVAFLPQHVAMLAAVNNDSLAELIIAALLFLLINLIIDNRSHGRFPPNSGSRSLRKPMISNRQNAVFIILGILLGLGFLTKLTVYIMIPLIGLVLIWLNWGNWRKILHTLIIVFGIAALIGLGWWLRNIMIYGGIDFMGTGAHNAVVVGQPRTEEWIAERGLAGTLTAFIRTSFQSFWGQFGWMGVVMPAWIYAVLFLFSIVTALGLVWAFTGGKNQWAVISVSGNASGMRDLLAPMLLLLGTFFVSLCVYLTYNLTFVQHQGRYLFSGLIPIGIGVAIAWRMLMLPLVGRWSQVKIILPTMLIIALVGLDLLALFWFIIPALTTS